MQVPIASTKLRSRAGRRPGPHRPRSAAPPAAAPPAAAPPAAVRETDRHRRAGGPEDRALYDCACGCHFQADVTASVTCPGCGAGQAW